MTLQQERVYDARYPARRILSVIADTWTPIVLYCLRDRTRRFNELQRSIPDISKKMLTQTLRKLERDKLVSRVVHPVVPPHVDYSLTRLGGQVAEAVSLLCEWAAKNEETLKALPSPDRKSDAKRRTSSGARSKSAPARSR